MNSRQRRKKRRREKVKKKNAVEEVIGTNPLLMFAMGGLATHFIDKFFTGFMENVEKNKKPREKKEKPAESEVKKPLVRKLEVED